MPHKSKCLRKTDSASVGPCARVRPHMQTRALGLSFIMRSAHDQPQRVCVCVCLRDSIWPLCKYENGMRMRTHSGCIPELDQ